MSSKNVTGHAVSHEGKSKHVSSKKSQSFRPKLFAVTAGSVGALMLGGGVFAAWVPTASTAAASYQAASLNVTMVDTNGTTFSVGVNNLLPGDYLNRYLDVTNTGTVAQTFSGTVTPTGVLAAAMTVQVDSCSVAWAANGTCSGTTTPVKAATSTSGTVTFAYPSMTANAVNRTRVQFKLDPLAALSFQGTTATQTVSLIGNATTAGGADRTLG